MRLAFKTKRLQPRGLDIAIAITLVNNIVRRLGGCVELGGPGERPDFYFCFFHNTEIVQQPPTGNGAPFCISEITG